MRFGLKRKHKSRNSAGDFRQGVRMSECKCTLRTKLVGDGCSICNPQLAIDMLEQELAEVTAERDELKKRISSLCCFEEYALYGKAAAIERVSDIIAERDVLKAKLGNQSNAAFLEMISVDTIESIMKMPKACLRNILEELFQIRNDYFELKAKLDGGVRVSVVNKRIVSFEPFYDGVFNATLIIDDGVTP